MNVLLIQPPDPQELIKPCPLTASHSMLFAPSWDLLCLRAFMLERTKHLVTLVDCRLFSDLEKELVEAIRNELEPRVIAVNATSHALGQTAAVLAIAKRNFPEIRTILLGEFPSQFPEHVSSMPSVDFALSGDPEPILRNLLDHFDVPQRLRRIPGLIYEGGPEPRRYWLPQLHSLSLPVWKNIFWSAYRTTHIRAEARISRGHTRLPADRAFGRGHEPLRIWPLERVADIVQRSGHLGIAEVVMTDPPGVWDEKRILDWCKALRRLRNRQPWVIRLLPVMLSPDTVSEMRSVGCSRVELIIPSCDPELLALYDCLAEPEEIKQIVELLQLYEIDIAASFWYGGPEERAGEPERVLNMIQKLDYLPATLHPFPFAMHSMLYAAVSELTTTPHLEDWINWSRDPWTTERPLPLWGGEASIARFEAAGSMIHKALVRSPSHWLKWCMDVLRTTNWIRAIEDKAVQLMVRPGTRE